MPQGTFEPYLECFLWDLVDEGIDDTLDRIKMETGVTGIVIPLHCTGIDQFRPHAGVSPRRFRSAGGAQFQPDAGRYAGTRMRPVVADWLRKSNPLKAVAEGCKARNLKLGGAVYLCCSSEVAKRYEHARTKDVFGDADAWLCPVNVDVQEYAYGLLADLSENYAFDELHVGRLGFPFLTASSMWHHTNEYRGFVLGPVENWLRTICFCESCRQQARATSVDVEAAAAVVREALERACASGVSMNDAMADFAEEHEALARYLVWRQERLQTFLQVLRRSSKCPLGLEHHQEKLYSGIDVAAALPSYDFLVKRHGDRTNVQQIEAAVDHAGTLTEATRLTLRVDAGAGCTNSDALVASLNKLVKSGARSAYITSYGVLPLERLDWIRQAVRYARRESV